MPRFRMVGQITGTRDGQDWPAPGGVVDLSDADGAHMVAAGLVAALPVEAATAPVDVETATVDATPRRRRPRA